MAVMLEKLYDALRAAGADDDKARDAAVESAAYENRINRVDADLTLIKWMVGFNLALTLSVFAKLFLGH